MLKVTDHSRGKRRPDSGQYGTQVVRISTGPNRISQCTRGQPQHGFLSRLGTLSTRRSGEIERRYCGHKCERLNLHPFDMGSETTELLIDQLISSIDMVDPVDLCLTFRLQTGQD